MPNQRQSRLGQALKVLRDLDMPRTQINDRSALCLLALLDLTPRRAWSESLAPLIGITPIMDWVRQNYRKGYAPNTRETFRRQTMHQFIQAGIAHYNPDLPNRPVNSPAAVYQITPECLAVVRSVGTRRYRSAVAEFLTNRGSLAQRYAMEREMAKVPLLLTAGREIALSPGRHSQLIRKICEEFGPRFIPGGQVAYVGDTGEKWGYFDDRIFRVVGVTVDDHGKMPDVVFYYPDKGWLILAEAVTSHGPVDAKRHQELAEMFRLSRAGLVFLSAFPDRRTFIKYAKLISWETDVWIADEPTHLIHFNGIRFLGPYPHE